MIVVIQSVWIAPFVACGWAAGVVVKAFKLARASLAEGFERGAKP